MKYLVLLFVLFSLFLIRESSADSSATNQKPACSDMTTQVNLSLQKNNYSLDAESLRGIEKGYNDDIVKIATNAGYKDVVLASYNLAIGTYDQNSNLYSVSYSAILVIPSQVDVISLLPLYQAKGYLITYGISGYVQDKDSCFKQ